MQTRLKHIRRQLLCCFILALGMSPPAWAEKQVMLVLDASGSMWGQIDGEAKITIARDVVADMLKTWNADNHIGLVAYGHRTKGDCADIETVIPLGKLDSEAFTTAVAGLNPKGKTPLTAAVRAAAEKLKYTENAATVILVSDGVETCDADPCAAAAELKQAGVDFTTHVIGFDITEQEGQEQLQCVAKNTGGEYLKAENASGLKEALKTAVKKVEAKPAPAPAPAADPNEPVNLRLNAVLAEGLQPVGGNDIRVYREQADEFGKLTRVQVARDYYKQEVNFSLVPGDYVAVGYLGDAVAELPITLEPGKALAATLVYNAARIKITATLSEGGANVGGNDIRVYREVLDEFGKAARVQVSRDYYKEEVIFTIPAGQYVAAGYLGSAVAESPFTIEAGKGMQLQLNYNAARLKLNAALVSGGANVGSNDFRVLRRSSDEFGKELRAQIARDYYKAEVIFTIPAGEHVAVSYLGNAAAEQPITVEAGKSSAHTLIYNAGRLRVYAVTEAGGAPVPRNDFRVYREDADEFGEVKRVQVARDYYRQDTTFTIPAGDYVLESINGERRGYKKISIAAGQALEAEIVLNQ